MWRSWEKKAVFCGSFFYDISAEADDIGVEGHVALLLFRGRFIDFFILALCWRRLSRMSSFVQYFFCGPPLWLASCDFLLPCCPWLFNRCAFLRPAFVLFFTFFHLSFYLFHFLIFCHAGWFPASWPFPASQTARLCLIELLHCPREGFLTASSEPHISNW